MAPSAGRPDRPPPPPADSPAPVVIRRSRRARRARLAIGPDGEVLLTLPWRAPEAWAAELLAARSGWIARHRTRLLAQQARLAARPPLGGGRALSLGGVPHDVLREPLPAGRRRGDIVHDDTLAPTLRVRLATGDERPLAALLEPWLRREARAALERRVAVRAPALGVEPRALAVRDQRSRWGSASRRGAVSFNWRLVLAPPAVLDYVVVHELAHLREFGHGAGFWRLVRGVVPDADLARRWLREHDGDLRRALS